MSTMTSPPMSRPRSQQLSRPLCRSSRPGGAPRPSTGTHLTARGRILLVLVAAVLLLGAFSLGRVASQAAPVDTAPPAALVQTTVQPGDTLWSLAQRIAPDNDPREVVRQIRSLNHLQGSTLQAGQQLLLPRAA